MMKINEKLFNKLDTYLQIKIYKYMFDCCIFEIKNLQKKLTINILVTFKKKSCIVIDYLNMCIFYEVCYDDNTINELIQVLTVM